VSVGTVAGARCADPAEAAAPAPCVDPEQAAGRVGIRVEGVTKLYGHGRDAVRALLDVSLTVFAGEAFALLGHNGAGKSTLIKATATLLRPDAGWIWIAGADAVREPAYARRLLGVALQESGLPHRQAAARVIARHARLHGMSASAAQARSAELMHSLALEAVADRAVATYSGGQRRRLDLALALVHRPLVILLDEPTVGLDVSSRRVIWSQLRAYMQAGATVLFSTHDLQEAEAHANRIAIIHHGRVLASDTPQVLKRRCAEPTLAGVFDRLTEGSPDAGP
jgi:ABC-2 type transport system ATP-binding protein